MTSHELAHKLLAGPDLMVTVRSYENGVDEVTTVYEPKPIRLNSNTEHHWWDGEHDYYYEFEVPPDAPFAIHIG